MLDIERLIAVDDPAWPHLQQALAESDVIALPVDSERGQRSLWGVAGQCRVDDGGRRAAHWRHSRRARLGSLVRRWQRASAEHR